MLLGIVVLALTALVTVSAETFHFEIDESSLNCDEGTDYVLHLQAFNLLCIDGIGCEQGGGILGATAFVADVTFPTLVHLVIHGCEGPLAQYCPGDELDDVIEVCDFLADFVTEDGFCSRDHRENRFGVGLPYPSNLIPLGPLAPKEVIVTSTFDDANYCHAKFSVRLEESPFSWLLGLGAPLVGVGVSYLLFTSYIMAYFQKERRAVVDGGIINEKIFPSFETTEDSIFPNFELMADSHDDGSIALGHQTFKDPQLEAGNAQGMALHLDLGSRVTLQARS
jgi:hypothetical protein